MATLNSNFPDMALVRQQLPNCPPVDLQTALNELPCDIRPGTRIAVAVGSRGITNLYQIIHKIVSVLRSAGAHPFIVPAMGSHGGATPTGQQALLAEYGITQASLGVPIEASLATTCLGHTLEGMPVHFSTAALASDGIVIVNRVKPHTDFNGRIGSGVLKMMVIGLGKRLGAETCHAASRCHNFENVLRSAAAVVLSTAPILCGVAIVEGPDHQTARINVVGPENIVATEEAMFQEAIRLMPRLPFEQIDLLIVDEMGKNISGAGLDPNVIRRSVHGYNSMPSDPTPVSRIFVRELSPQSHGNAIGLGLADFTTARLVRAIDRSVTSTNALTSLTLQSAKVPLHFETDREVITVALRSLGNDTRNSRIVRIRDTLSLAGCEVSAAFEQELCKRDDLERLGPYRPLQFDDFDNLMPLGT